MNPLRTPFAVSWGQGLRAQFEKRRGHKHKPVCKNNQLQQKTELSQAITTSAADIYTTTVSLAFLLFQ